MYSYMPLYHVLPDSSRPKEEARIKGGETETAERKEESEEGGARLFGRGRPPEASGQARTSESRCRDPHKKNVRGEPNIRVCTRGCHWGYGWG